MRRLCTLLVAVSAAAVLCGLLPTVSATDLSVEHVQIAGALRPLAGGDKGAAGAAAANPVHIPGQLPHEELNPRYADGKTTRAEKLPPLPVTKSKIAAAAHPVLPADEIAAAAKARAETRDAKLSRLAQAHTERVDLFHRFPARGTQASEPPRLKFAAQAPGRAGAFLETRSRALGRASALTEARVTLTPAQDRTAHTFPCPSLLTKARMKEGLTAAHISNMAYTIGTAGQLQVGRSYPVPSMNFNINVTAVLTNRLGPNRPDWGNWADFIGPAFVGHTADTVYAVFRGSDSVGDWIYDFRISGNTLTIGGDRQGISHHGFTLIWQSLNVFEAVQNALRMKPTIRRVVFTGHSLGGAVAYLASLEYALRRTTGYSAPELYTFGSPRPGNAELRDNIMERVMHIRYKHDNDPVPDVPIWGNRQVGPLKIPFIYRHGADASVLLDDVGYKCFSDDQPLQLVHAEVGDHSIVNGYIPALTRAYNGMSG